MKVKLTTYQSTMTRHLSLPYCIYCAIALFSILGLSQASEKPNILFIFADDFAFDCVGFMGNKEVKTPHLDELAARGTIFNRAYNPGAWGGAVCVASRTMMMTGKQVWSAKNTKLQQAVEQREFWPQLMQQRGYDTYFAGKWHVGPTKLCTQAWQNTLHIRPGMPNQTKERYSRDFNPNTKSWSPTDKSKQGFWKGGKHWSEVLADDAEQHFRSIKQSDNPFFMMLCFNAPHDPRQAPEEYQKMYPYSDISIPPNFQKEYPYDIGSNQIRDERLAPFPRTGYSVKVNRSEYYALITHLDDQVGRILDTLEKSGKADNTVIIFSADHGLACGQHGLIGKQNQHEHSVRAPWCITGPGIPVGKRINTPIYIQDAMATGLDLAGAKKPSYCDFQSVIPLLHQSVLPAATRTDTGRKVIYGAYVNFQRMVTTDGFKLIVYPQQKVELLYNLNKDPNEQVNLASHPEHATTLSAMRSALAQQMKQMKDPVDLNDPVNSYKAVNSRKRLDH